MTTLLEYLYQRLAKEIKDGLPSNKVISYADVDEIDVLGTIIGTGMTAKNKTQLFKNSGDLELTLRTNYPELEFSNAVENEYILLFSDINGNSKYSISHKGIIQACLLMEKDIVSSLAPLDKKIFEQKPKFNNEEKLIIIYLLAIGAVDSESILDTNRYSNLEIDKHYDALLKLYQLCFEKNLIPELNWDKKKNTNFRGFFGNLDSLTRIGLCDASQNKYNLNLGSSQKKQLLTDTFFNQNSVTYDKLLLINNIIEEAREILEFNFYFELRNTSFKF